MICLKSLLVKSGFLETAAAILTVMPENEVGERDVNTKAEFLFIQLSELNAKHRE